MYNTTMVDKRWIPGISSGMKSIKSNIIMYDSSRDSMAVALRKLGYSVNTKTTRRSKRPPRR